MSKEILPKVLEGEVVEKFNFNKNYETLRTPELKTYFRKVAEFKVELDVYTETVREHQISVATSLCTRHDAGDLIAFFKEINFNPPEEIKKEIMRRNAQLGVPHAVTAAATGKTTDAVRMAFKRMTKKSEMPGDRTPVRQTDTSDHTPPKPVKSDNGKKRRKSSINKKREAEIAEEEAIAARILAEGKGHVIDSRRTIRVKPIQEKLHTATLEYIILLNRALSDSAIDGEFISAEKEKPLEYRLETQLKKIAKEARSGLLKEMLDKLRGK